MRRALWILAIVIDALGLATGFSHFAAEAPPPVWFWGAIQVVIFGSLLIVLVYPRVIANPSRLRTVARILCSSVPVIALIASFDSGMISGLEWLAILVALLIGTLNWLAFRTVAVRKLTSPA